MKADKIIFATGNAGKMKEIRMIMADLDIEVQSMKEAEDRQRFRQRLLKMARHLKRTPKSKHRQSHRS